MSGKLLSVYIVYSLVSATSRAHGLMLTLDCHRALNPLSLYYTGTSQILYSSFQPKEEKEPQSCYNKLLACGPTHRNVNWTLAIKMNCKTPHCISLSSKE